MGKSYVENSLKRFLKRKVKITLGLVVAFMITGIVSFGADIDRNDYPLMNEENETIDMGYINAMESLNGLGNGNLTTGEISLEANTAQKIKITEENGNYKISYIGINTFPMDDKNLKSPTISKNVLSEKTISNINKFLNSENKEYILTENSITIDIKVNQVVQNNKKGTATQKATGINDITNNGYILATRGQLVENGKAINNGIIFTKTTAGGVGYIGQTATGKGELYNYGYIGLSSFAQSVKNGNAYNYGTAVTEFAQQSTGTGNLYNYGFLKATNSGNEYYGQQVGNSSAYNYGIVEAYRGSQNGREGKLYNYGTLIATSSSGEAQVSNGGRGENYGLIKVKDGLGMKGTGTLINRGVIHSSNSSKIFDTFNEKSENTGIIITNADVKDEEWSKTGVTLNGNYELQNTDTAVAITGNTLDKSSFGDKNIGYINAANNTNPIKLSEITREGDKKVLGVVADDKITVFESDSNLLLDGIDMTGYLINGGTFIDMKGNSLILSDANITVTEDLTKTNGEKAVAVDLGKTGNLTLMGDSKINGVIKGGASSKLEALAQKDTINTETEGELTFKNVDSENLKEVNYTNVTLTGTKAGSIKSEFTHTSDGKENTITIGEKFVVGDGKGDYTSKDVIVDKSLAGNKVNYIIENLDNIHGNIKLGAGENTVTVTDSKFKNYNGTIDLGSGDSDKFVAEGTGNSVFNYHVQNAETIELNGGTWGDWTNAQGTISFDKITKAENYPKLTLGEKETKINITLGTEDNGSDFAEYIAGLGEALGTNHLVIHGTGQDVSTAKYLIGADGVNFDNLSTTRYSFDDKVNYKDSPIFNISSDEGKGVNISVKTAGEMGLSGQHRIIYEAYLNEIKADGNVNSDVIWQLNNRFTTSEEFANHIRKTNITGEAYYTAGSVVTMDIADTYLSGVEDFTKRAGKGEWLAQGKYINSDTEFDGGSKVKGYDGDVTGTMGMIEYGFTDNTSYGIVYGQGDSEMDIDGGGKLDGDNIYAGLYMKHRTQNGIELVANLGYVENDMDSVLKNNFRVDGISGNTFEKGTADSSAVILSVKGRKDYRITDTVKVQPILGARATFINQEEAENPEMHFTIKEQDIIVVEGTAGMGIAKEFALPQGKLELNAGVEYTFAATSSTNDAEYTLFDETTVKLEDVDTAENTGTAFAGFDYEHESGVGFNGKYEMMWSDKGDDSRITAGISYRF